MSEIKLEKSKTAEAGTNSDIDHEDVPFNKLTLNVVHPVSKQEIYIEYNKSDSKDVLVEKEDGAYVEEANVKYLKQVWAATEYHNFLETSTLVSPSDGDLGVGVPSNTSVPKSTNTYDEVYVNKKLVRTDYNIGLHQAKPLIEEIEKVFGKDQDWKQNKFNILGTYTAHDDAPLRPPYTNVKTYSWYNVYSKPTQELLDEFKVKDVGYTYKIWHSIKYNTVSGKKQLKAVISDDEYTCNYQTYLPCFYLVKL